MQLSDLLSQLNTVQKPNPNDDPQVLIGIGDGNNYLKINSIVFDYSYDRGELVVIINSVQQTPEYQQSIQKLTEKSEVEIKQYLATVTNDQLKSIITLATLCQETHDLPAKLTKQLLAAAASQLPNCQP